MPWRFTGNRLIAPDGTEYTARSGPHGRGRLPAGDYTIGRAMTLGKSQPRFRSYTDPSGFAWWCPLEPNFSTARSGLGIHPDGGVSGTLGCIGLTARNTRPAYNAVKEAHGQTLTVE